MQETRMLRGLPGIALWSVILLIVVPSGSPADQKQGSLYGEISWSGFVDDLEELYRPTAGWALGYIHP
ncbi:MAG: hypothetical protein GF355_13685, partial [Candidatus Eisenbacteria bacterium]|nr:hypothetical protein [Candidatus Eisenbacteria bacterium]